MEPINRRLVRLFLIFAFPATPILLSLSLDYLKKMIMAEERATRCTSSSSQILWQFLWELQQQKKNHHKKVKAKVPLLRETFLLKEKGGWEKHNDSGGGIFFLGIWVWWWSVIIKYRETANVNNGK